MGSGLITIRAPGPRAFLLPGWLRRTSGDSALAGYGPEPQRTRMGANTAGMDRLDSWPATRARLAAHGTTLPLFRIGRAARGAEAAADRCWCRRPAQVRRSINRVRSSG